MNKPEYQSTIDSFVDEFRTDTVGRIESIIRTVAEHQASEGDASVDFPTIVEQIHSIKGTAKTFGFGGLSHVTHALNDWMHDISNDNLAAIDPNDPALDADIQIFLSLMLTITRAKDRLPEQQGIRVLAETKFALYR